MDESDHRIGKDGTLPPQASQVTRSHVYKMMLSSMGRRCYHTAQQEQRQRERERKRVFRIVCFVYLVVLHLGGTRETPTATRSHRNKKERKKHKEIKRV